MVFLPPPWVPQLPEVPDSITVDEFITSNAHGRRPHASAKNPYTCGLSGLSRSSVRVSQRIEWLARAIAARLEFHPATGTAWDRVITLYSFNTLDYIPISFAIHRINGIVSLAAAACTSDELAQQLRVAGVKALFTCVPLLKVALSAAMAAGIPRQRIFIMPMSGAESDSSFVTADDLEAEGRLLPHTSPSTWTKGQGARQTAYLGYSSGTSGLPKAVMLSHRNVIANILQTCIVEAVSRHKLAVETQTILGVLPLSHIYGLVLVALVAHYRGDEIVILPSFDLDKVLAAVQQYRIEQLSVVPPILIQIISNKDKCARYDLSSVRWIFSGAAPLGSEVVERLCELFPKWRLGQGYGSLLPGVKAKLMDSNGREVKELEKSGELLIQSPSVVLGYFNNEKATAETFVWHNDGRWIRTGDVALVRKSAQGHEHFLIVDRIKELIKVKGFQVAPAELEAHLLSHALVSDCAVIPVPDWRAGELPKAVVVKADAARLLSDTEAAAVLQRFVEDHKPPHKWLRGGIDFVEAVPRSPSGKILRRLLRDQQKQLRPVADSKL